MIAIALSVASVLGGVLCAEARGMLDMPDGLREVAAIAQVAQNIAHRDGRSLVSVLRTPGQWARPTCPAGAARRFVAVARRFLAGSLVVPRWAHKAVAFCTVRASKRVGARWRRLGFVPLGGTHTIHVFWRYAR